MASSARVLPPSAPGADGGGGDVMSSMSVDDDVATGGEQRNGVSTITEVKPKRVLASVDE